MCQGDTGRIVEMSGKKAAVLQKGSIVEVNVEFLDDANEGDFILFAGGVALQKLSRKEAERLGDSYELQ